MQITPGIQIGKYQLGKQLGQGGFGAVFIARDVELSRDVAIKFLLPEHSTNAQILSRFLQEARSAAKIGHPSIVTVYESGTVEGTLTRADGAAYIVMELLKGETLGARLARLGRMPVAAAIDVCWEVASALDAAHAAGIIHRDLKPDNVFLMTDPALDTGEPAKVLDFGIAKLADSGGTSGVHTGTLMVFGTPRYMSPEQCRSSARIDQRSDIYSLGCILFELLAGRPPFVADPGELLALQQLAQPPTVGSLVPDIPPGLDALVMRMLAKDPASRPSTMAEVQHALRSPSTSQNSFPAVPVSAIATAAPITQASPKRRRWILPVVGVCVIAAAIPIAGFTLRRGSVDDTPLPPDVGVALLGVMTPKPKPARPIDPSTQSARAIPMIGRPDAKLAQEVRDVRAGSNGVTVGSSGSAGVGPAGRVSVVAKQALDESTLTPDVVLAKIQSVYMAGIKRCYQTLLEKTPTVRGKLVLAFTVNESGRTVNGKATSFETELDACITGLINMWRFPSPKDRDAESTEASFSITLQLVPD